MIKFKTILLLTLVMMLLWPVACSQRAAINDDDPVEPIEGRIYELEDQRILIVRGLENVNVPLNDWFEGGYRAVWFTVTADTRIYDNNADLQFEDLKRGQLVAVGHEGFLAESYPEQGGALRVEIIENTPAADYQVETGRFAGLTEENQLALNISGVPDQMPARVYNLTPEAEAVFETLQLEVEEVIVIRYLPDTESEGLIFDLGRVEN